MMISLKGFKVSTAKKAKVPLIQFYDFIAEKLGGIPKGSTMDVQKVSVSTEDSKKLISVMRAWYKKQYPGVSQEAINDNVGFDYLGYGPTEEKKLEPGKVWVKSGVFKKKIGPLPMEPFVEEK